MFVGIDLGTTKCAVAIAEPSAEVFDFSLRHTPEAYDYVNLEIEQPIAGNLKQLQKRSLLPSFLYVNDYGDIIIGEGAARYAFQEPDRAITSGKLWLGQEVTFRVAGKQITPVEVAAHMLTTILRTLKSRGDQFQKFVVTVPACFDLRQKQAVLKAAQLAGLPTDSTQLMLLDEPTAAFLSLLSHKNAKLRRLVDDWIGRDRSPLVLVVDIGGGTFDISAIRLNYNTALQTIEPIVLATSQRSEAAGEHFDEAIAKYVADRFIWNHQEFSFEHLSENQSIELAGSLLEVVSEIKRGLSRQHYRENGTSTEYKDVTLPTDTGSIGVSVNMDADGLRDALYELISPDSPRSVQSQIRRVLDDDKLRNQKPDIVLLAGQMSQLWLIKDAIEEVLPGIEAHPVPFPAHAIARGAAVQAATGMISQQFLPSDMLLRVQRGFVTLSERGTWVPTEKKEKYGIVKVPYANCRGMALEIWQGNEEDASQQWFKTKWISFPFPLSEGAPIDLAWTIESNYQPVIEARYQQTRLEVIDIDVAR